MIHCIRTGNEFATPMNPNITSPNSPSSSSKIPHMCDIQLFESDDGYACVSTGIFISALVLHLPTISGSFPPHSPMAFNNHRSDQHPPLITTKKLITSVINFFESSNEGNVFLNHKISKRKGFIKLDTALEHFLGLLQNHIEMAINQSCQISIDDLINTNENGLIVASIDVLSDFLKLLGCLPVLYSSSMRSFGSNSVNDNTNRISSEETIFILVQLWRIQYHIQQLVGSYSNRLQSAKQTIDPHTASNVTPNQTPSKVSNPSPTKSTTGSSQKIITVLQEIVDNIDRYSRMSVESLTSWMDVIISSNVMKQDWSSTSPYMRNRKITPCLILVTSFIKLIQNRFKLCTLCSKSVIDDNNGLDPAKRDLIGETSVANNEHDGKINERSENPDVNADSSNRVISFFSESANNSPVKNNVPTRESVITPIKSIRNMTQSIESFETTFNWLDIETRFYSSVVESKVNSFMIDLLEGLCRCSFYHYGIVSTELGDMLNASLSRVRLLQWQVDVTFLYEEISNCVKPFEDHESIAFLRSSLSLMEVVLFLSRSKTEDVINWVKLAISPDAQLKSGNENIHEKSQRHALNFNGLEGYCCMVEDIRNEKIESQEDRKCLFDELKVVHEKLDKSINVENVEIVLKIENGSVPPVRIGWVMLALRNLRILNMFKPPTSNTTVSNGYDLAGLWKNVSSGMDIDYVNQKAVQNWMSYVLTKFRFELIDAAYPPLTEIQKEEQSKLKELLASLTE